MPEEDAASKPTDDESVFVMSASSSSLLFVNLSGIITGAALLGLLLVFRNLFTLTLFIVGAIVITVYMVVDYIRWQKNGIRIVEVDPKGITLFRGKEKKPSRITAGQITDVNIFKKINSRRVIIFTGGRAERVAPGVTLFSGPRIKLTDDAFNDKEFDVFIEKVQLFKEQPGR